MDVQLGFYRHYKGNVYKVLAVGKHTETLEDLVIYQDVVDNKKIWVRPLKMFIEDVTIDGKTQKRFEYIEGKNLI